MSPAGGWSWRTFWAALVVLSTLLGLWGLATPLFAVPDEPAHVLKSAAVVRGQLTGPSGTPTAVDVPPALESIRLQAGCFAFQPQVTADCAPGYAGPTEGPDRRAFTQAGRYPPGYYALVGLPTLVRTDLGVVHAVRGVSAALCAALLAAAVTAAASTGSRLLVVGVGVATTPMALFLASGVNPSGPEIAAAIALWSAGLALVLAGELPAAPVLNTAGIAAVVLALSRPISPFWVALIGLGLLLVAGRRRTLELARRRSFQVWMAVLVAAGALQAGWVLGVGALELYGAAQDLTVRERLEGSLALTDERLQQMVGWFGWLDTPAPLGVHLAWAVALLGIVLLGLRAARPARAALVVLLVTGTVALPVVLELGSANTVGFYWQGRYTLPLAVGVPLVAAVAGHGARRVPRSLLAVVVAVLAACHLLAFVTALGRYTVGTGNGWGLLDVVWSPPLPAVALAAGVAVAALAWSGLVLLAPVAQPERAEEVVGA